MDLRDPWRAVKDARFYQPMYSRSTSSACELTLECGHKAYRKGSQVKTVPKRVRCRECR